MQIKQPSSNWELMQCTPSTLKVGTKDVESAKEKSNLSSQVIN